MKGSATGCLSRTLLAGANDGDAARGKPHSKIRLRAVVRPPLTSHASHT